MPPGGAAQPPHLLCTSASASRYFRFRFSILPLPPLATSVSASRYFRFRLSLLPFPLPDTSGSASRCFRFRRHRRQARARSRRRRHGRSPGPALPVGRRGRARPAAHAVLPRRAGPAVPPAARHGGHGGPAGRCPGAPGAEGFLRAPPAAPAALPARQLPPAMGVPRAAPRLGQLPAPRLRDAHEGVRARAAPAAAAATAETAPRGQRVTHGDSE